MAEKLGFKTNLLAVNPFNPEVKVPVYFANFVLIDYGFGVLLVVQPTTREILILQKYKLEIKTVVRPKEENDTFKVKDEAYAGPGIITTQIF